MDQYMLIKEYYGMEVIEMHIASHKQRNGDESQFLRSMQQHQEIIQ